MEEVEQPIQLQVGLEIVSQEGSGNGKAPATEGTSGEIQAATKVCMPCLIARVVLLAVAGALLIAIVVQERKKAAAK